MLLEGRRVDILRPFLGDGVYKSVRASVGRMRRKKLEPYLRAPDGYWDYGEKRLGRSIWAGKLPRQRVRYERWELPIEQYCGGLGSRILRGALDALRDAFRSRGLERWDTSRVLPNGIANMIRYENLWDAWWDDDSWKSMTYVPDQWKRMWEVIGHPEGEVLVSRLLEMLFGAHDAPWLMAYDYGRRECGFDYGDLLGGLLDLAQCCGWWAPYNDLVILQHRPCEIHLGKPKRVMVHWGIEPIEVRQRLLHNPKGMVVKYRDGWGIHGKVSQNPEY
jgi:hypothetical protein